LNKKYDTGLGWNKTWGSHSKLNAVEKEFLCFILKQQDLGSEQPKFEAKNTQFTLLQNVFFFTTTK